MAIRGLPGLLKGYQRVIRVDSYQVQVRAPLLSHPQNHADHLSISNIRVIRVIRAIRVIPELAPMTGVPHAKVSMNTKPMGSCQDGNTPTSAIL